MESAASGHFVPLAAGMGPLGALWVMLSLLEGLEGQTSRPVLTTTQVLKSFQEDKVGAGARGASRQGAGREAALRLGVQPGSQTSPVEPLTSVRGQRCWVSTPSCSP